VEHNRDKMKERINRRFRLPAYDFGPINFAASKKHNGLKHTIGR
jgi:hypothetical protein